MSGPIYNKLKRFSIASIVAILAFQSTLLATIILPGKAQAASASITQLAFTTSEQTIKTNHKSQVIIVETRNSEGLPEAVSANTDISLVSESSTGRFSENGISSWTHSKDITIPIGQSSASFYYKDSSAGSPQLSATLDGDNTVSQMITVSDDVTDPINAEVTNITDDSYYNSTTIPSSITGIANDNGGGIGLAENSTVFLLKKTVGGLDTFWDGSAWIDDNNSAWLPTTHEETSGNIEAAWTSNANLPAWEENVTYKIKVKAIDKVGNDYKSGATRFYFDNTAPTFIADPMINEREDVTNNPAIVFFPEGDTDAKYMKIWGDITTPDSDYETYANFKNLNLTDGNGWKTIHILLKDKAGNISVEKTASIFFSTDVSTNPSDSVSKDITTTGTDNSTDIFSDGGSVEISASTTSGTTKLFATKYSKNPISGTTGIKFLNNFYDFSIADDSIIDWTSVQIKIYFTEADLSNAGISRDDLSALGGLFYYDFRNTNKWTKYADTGIVFSTDKVGYIGYVHATVSHFTPMAIGIPGGISNLTAQATETEVTLNWDKISDAAGYWVKYRKANTSDDFKTIFIDGNNNSVKISSLSEKTEYEFAVAAKYISDNTSSLANVSNFTSIKKTTLEKTVTVTKKKFVGTALAASNGSTSTTSTNSDNQIKTETPKDDTVAPNEETNNNDSSGINWTKLAVTLGIIVLAAGAGFGGYYGYQWWVGGSQEEEKKDERKLNKKNSKRDGRW